MKFSSSNIFLPVENQEQPSIPLFLDSVQAGFPSPAQDFIEKRLDLNELVIKHPAATFFVKVQGRSMEDAHIFEGDILVVDRAITPKHEQIVVAILHGEFTVKRLIIENEKVFLAPENTAFKKIEITEAMEAKIFGVVTYIIHKAS